MPLIASTSRAQSFLRAGDVLWALVRDGDASTFALGGLAFRVLAELRPADLLRAISFSSRLPTYGIRAQTLNGAAGAR